MATTGTTDINTLLVSDALQRNVNLTTAAGTAGTLRLGANGGIMTAIGVGGPVNLNGGTLTAGGASGGAGQINLQLNQQLTVNSAITDNTNGAVSLNVNTYTGLSNSALNLNAANSYSGGTVINSGRVQLGNAAGLGTGLVTIEPEGQLFAQNLSAPITNNFAPQRRGRVWL